MKHEARAVEDSSSYFILPSSSSPFNSPMHALKRDALERLEERDELILLRGGEVAVVVYDSRGLARVAQNRVVAVGRLAVVHETAACAHAPERRGAQLVSR